MDEVLTIPAETTPAESASIAPTEAAPVKPRWEKSPSQLGYKELREKVKSLEVALAAASRNAECFIELTARNEKLRAENDELLVRLTLREKAETEYRQAESDKLHKALALFEGRSAVTRSQFPDYQQVLENKPEFLREDVLREIVEMESGPFALYVLAKDPVFSHTLQNLPLRVAMERIARFVLHAEQQVVKSNIATQYFAATSRSN